SCQSQPHDAPLPNLVDVTDLPRPRRSEPARKPQHKEARRSMKSHPDAASRQAAEVVTQLPVPSRLGMLRFERINEPSWSLLFLDPACERQLGVSAGELCALLDCPYASLMEPEARYSLHEDIQRQLASTQHYSVRYRLHTPNGALHMLEIGESYQQRGRQLL